MGGRPTDFHLEMPSGWLGGHGSEVPHPCSLCFRAFTTLCYSADGQSVLAGGMSKFVCIYHVKEQILRKKFEISSNLSLDAMEVRRTRVCRAPAPTPPYSLAPGNLAWVHLLWPCCRARPLPPHVSGVGVLAITLRMHLQEGGAGGAAAPPHREPTSTVAAVGTLPIHSSSERARWAGLSQTSSGLCLVCSGRGWGLLWCLWRWARWGGGRSLPLPPTGESSGLWPF